MNEYKWIVKEINLLNNKFIPVQLIYGVFSGLYFSVFLYFPKFILKEVTLISGLSSSVMLIVTMVVVTAIVKFITMVIETFNSDNHLCTTYLLRMRVYQKNAKIPYHETKDVNVRNMFESAQVAAYNLPKMMSALHVGMMGASIRLVMTIFFLGNINWGCVVLVVSVSLILFFYRINMDKKIHEYNNQKNRINRIKKYFSEISFSSEHGEHIRIYDLENFLDFKIMKCIRMLETKEKERISVLLKKKRGEVIGDLFQKAFVYICMIIAFGNKQLSVEDFVIGVPILLAFTKSINDLASNVLSLSNLKYYVIDYRKWIDKEEDKAGLSIEKKIDKIRFEDVSFSYPNGTKTALKHCSFSAYAGEKIMIVGENGAGKSTIINLLLGFYKPTTGNIYINEHKVDEIDNEFIWRKVIAIYQDCQIYNYTIKDNVQLGYDASDDDVIHALYLAGMENLTQLDLDRYAQTQLHELGKNFSGGENQQIAISRVGLRKPDLSVMDEPTSALNPIIERKLFERFCEKTSSDILFVVSHRIANAKAFDKIIVMKQGEIGEMGTHDELIRLRGQYYNMYMTQKEIYAQ